MMMKKFEADSYYEAFLKAQTELGEEMIVVTSRTITKGSWGGIYKREMVEITAAVPKSPMALRGGKTAPIRPSLSEEVSLPTPPAPPPPLPRPAPGKNALVADPPPLYGPNLQNRPPVPAAYPAQPGVPPRAIRPSRQSHTIRSVQVGDEEPHPQRLGADEETHHHERVQALLGAILKERENRTPTQHPPAIIPEGEPIPTNQHGPSSLNALETKISEMFAMLQEMQAGSQKALDYPNTRLPPALADLRRQFLAMEMPADVADEIVGTILRDLPMNVLHHPEYALPEITRWLEEHIQITAEPELPPATEPAIFILVGPTGVGKTTTIAKLAASFALNVIERRSVALFTLDTFRIGAPAQLSQYAQIIEADMEILYDPEEILPTLERHRQKDVILVDTAGRCQKNKQELSELRRFLGKFPPARRYLVLSATTKFSDMIESVRRFSEVGFDHLIFTKVDETNSLGPLLALLLTTRLPLAYFTNGQSVPDDFRLADRNLFLSRIFSNPRTKI